MSRLKRVDITDLWFEVSGRRLVVKGEPVTLSTGEVVFGVFPPDTWRWADRSHVSAQEVRDLVADLALTAAEEGYPMDLSEAWPRDIR